MSILPLVSFRVSAQPFYIRILSLVFSFLTIFSLSIVLPRSIFAVCNVNVSTAQLNAGACGSIQTGGSCAGQYQCTGTDENGAVCTACVAPPTEQRLTCTRPVDNPTCTESLGYTYSGSCTGSSSCTGNYGDGCQYCVTPVCTPGNCYDGSAADANDITCAPCGTQTLAQINGQDSLSITLDSTNGTTYNSGQSTISVSGLTVPSYSTFSSANAIANTYILLTGNNGWFSETRCDNAQVCPVGVPSQGSYTLTAVFPQQTANGLTYPSSSDTAPLIVWNPGQQPGQTTCSLSASPQSLNTGGSSTWTLTSTGEPEGARGYWHGNTASVEGRVTAPDYIDVVLYDNSGSDSRYVEVKNSSGTTLCTTDTIQVYVNPNYCSALSIAPSSLNLAVGGTGQLTAFGVNGSISSWSSDNTSIVSVTSFGNPTTVTGRGAGTTVIS